MKTSFQNDPIHPALFRIAAIIGNPITPTDGISAPAKLKKDVAAFRRDIAELRAVDIVKPQPEMPVRETCGWSFPIRK